MPPCILFEDEHLLVVNKPAGWNTHAPSPFHGEGIYDWLRHREPNWASLAIVHRLDKETSGVLVFGKTPLANKSLTAQFTARTVHKTYLLLTDRPVPERGCPQPQHAAGAIRLELEKGAFVVKSSILRAGDRYVSSPQGEPAETHFKPGAPAILHPPSSILSAHPLTGRTHQIRVHAAESGFPILGDTLYGGSPFHRVCLHAAEITFTHPATQKPVTFTAPADFATDTALALRTAIIDPDQTDAFRLIHGASDHHPGWYVEKLGEYLLSQSEAPLTENQTKLLRSLTSEGLPVGVQPLGWPPNSLKAEPQPQSTYHKLLTRRVQKTTPTETSPQLISGSAAPDPFVIRENGVKFELSFNEGYSVGLFLDQRDNRRRFLTHHIAAGFPLSSPIADRMPSNIRQQEKLGAFLPLPKGEGRGEGEGRSDRTEPLEVLNTFAYTCAFSVCAALAGARTTSLDLSKKYLEWGKLNFVLNGLDPAAHDFIFGDTFDWLKRFAKKGRAFDVIVLDPPTFSRSKESGTFQAEKDYERLVAAALPVLKPDGVLLASTNAATLPPEDFLEMITSAIRGAKRKIAKQHYVPQPPDFPITREEPAYLKTVWLKIN